MIFRPSARVKLTIRTDEFNQTDTLERWLPNPFTEDADPTTGFRDSPFGNSPQSPEISSAEGATEALQRNQERFAELERRRDVLVVEQYDNQRQQLVVERDEIMRAAVSAEEPEVVEPPVSVSGTPPDDLTVIGDIAPMSVQIERNGLATAGTATIVLDYTNAPFDPRIIRAAHVEILLGVVPADDYEAGVERGETRDDGSLLSIVGSQADGNLGGATRFVGFVDQWGVKYSDEGDTITLECRDMSAPFRDLRLNSGESIDLNLPIDEGVQGFVDSVSASLRGVRVSYQGEGDPPTPADVMSQRRGSRRRRQRRRARRGSEEMSIWDHITDVVRGLGLLPVIRDFELLLIEPRTLFATTGTKRMVYGRNVGALEFTRRLAGVKVPTIEVRCYDPDIGRVRWARYPVRSGERRSGVIGRENPPRALRANEVPPSGANPEESIRTLVVSGITDGTMLERIARNSFEQIGRQEIEGALETNDVSSYGVDPGFVDLLLMQSGDPVELLVASGDPEGGEDELQPNSTLSQLQAMTRQQRRAYFVSLGWSEAVADRFAILQEVTGFQTVFRVQDVRISWDSDEGVKVHAGFVNYITIREDEAAE